MLDLILAIGGVLAPIALIVIFQPQLQALFAWNERRVAKMYDDHERKVQEIIEEGRRSREAIRKKTLEDAGYDA